MKKRRDLIGMGGRKDDGWGFRWRGGEVKQEKSTGLRSNYQVTTAEI